MKDKRKAKARRKEWTRQAFNLSMGEPPMSDVECDCGHNGLPVAFHLASCPFWREVMASWPG